MSAPKIVTHMLGEENVITPSNVYSREFKTSTVGGYKKAEVDTYLDDLADAMEALQNQVRELRTKNDVLEHQIQDYVRMEKGLRDTLACSREFGEGLMESAKREAQAIIEQAKAEKARIEVEIARLPEKLTQDIRLLRQQRAQLRSELLAALDTHRRIVISMCPDEMGRSQDTERPREDTFTAFRPQTIEEAVR